MGLFLGGSISGCATGKWGFIDKDEKVAIQQKFEDATPFTEGLAGGYIFKTGQMAIRPQYDGAYPFHDGLAMVKIGRSTGYIDKTGRYLPIL